MKLTDRVPTATGVPEEKGRLEVWFQRAGVVVLGAIVVAALLGWLGPRSTTVEATAQVGTLEFRHQSTTRAGLETESTVIATPRRSTETIELSLDRDALQVWGVDAFLPAPLTQRSEGDRVILEFAASGSRAVEILLIGRTGTNEAPGSTDWTLRWEAPDGPEVAGSVRVMP